METLADNLHHVDKRLQFRLRMYFAISIVLLAVILYNIVTQKLPVAFGLFGIAIGIAVGILSVRMFRISWDHDANTTVSRLDAYGVVILVLYILFEIKRKWIISHFVPAQTIGTTSFAVLTGVMIGRLVGTRGKIMQVLKEQKVFG